MYKVIISGIPDISVDEFLKELSRHGEIKSLKIEANTATVTVKDQSVAECILDDYRDRYFRGVPVTAKQV